MTALAEAAGNASERDTWAAYTGGCPAARDRLIVRHYGLVHHVARQLSRLSSSGMSTDEMVSAGTTGLLSAVACFDHSRGLAFSTFAAPRIRGAILDEIRREDPVSRSLRRKARDMRAAANVLGAKLGRAPDRGEMAEMLSITETKFREWERDVAASSFASMDGPMDGPSNGGEAQNWAESLADSKRDALDTLAEKEDLATLKCALAKLPARDRTVLSLYYFENLTQDEIASAMQLSGSRICQIQSRALAKLRALMPAVDR